MHVLGVDGQGRWPQQCAHLPSWADMVLVNFQRCVWPLMNWTVTTPLYLLWSWGQGVVVVGSRAHVSGRGRRCAWAPQPTQAAEAAGSRPHTWVAAV